MLMCDTFLLSKMLMNYTFLLSKMLIKAYNYRITVLAGLKVTYAEKKDNRTARILGKA